MKLFIMLLIQVFALNALAAEHRFTGRTGSGRYDHSSNGGACELLIRTDNQNKVIYAEVWSGFFIYSVKYESFTSSNHGKGNASYYGVRRNDASEAINLHMKNGQFSEFYIVPTGRNSGVNYYMICGDLREV